MTAYRNRPEPRSPGPSAIVLIEAKPFVRDHRENVPHGLGVAVLGDCHEIEFCDVSSGTVDLLLFDPPLELWAAQAGLRSRMGPSARLGILVAGSRRRVLKPNGTIVICCGEPLASVLTAAHLEAGTVCQHWARKASNIFQSRWRPLNVIEPILVFSHAAQRERTYNAETEKLKQTLDRLARQQAPISGSDP